MEIRPEDLDIPSTFDDVPSNIQPHEIIAHDPRNINPYTSASMVEGNMVSGSKRKRWYNHVPKRNKLNRRNRKRSSRIKGEIIQLSLHTLNTAVYSDLETALRVRHQVFPALYAHYNASGRLKLKFEVKCAKKRAKEQLIQFIRGDEHIRLVSIGNGMKMSGIKGISFSVPHQKVKRELSRRYRRSGGEWFVREVDEFVLLSWI